MPEFAASLARRPDHFQGLETRYRICKQMCVEANVRMQALVRELLDENNKLHIELNKNGVTNDELDGFALSPSPPASAALHDIPSPVPGIALAPMHLQQQSEWIPPPSPMRQLTHLMPTGNLSLSPRSVTSWVPGASSDPGEGYHSPYHRSEYGQRTLDIDTSAWQPYQNPNGVTSMLVTSYPGYGYSSCVDAANVIRSIENDAGVNLETTLGREILGTDCQADSSRVFIMTDKYSNPSISPWG